MTKSYTFYSSLTQLTVEHWPVVAAGGRRIYVRAQFNDCDYNEAMDRVKPMEGETFLNCVPA